MAMLVHQEVTPIFITIGSRVVGSSQAQRIFKVGERVRYWPPGSEFGGTPVAGWLMSWKNPSIKWMMILG